MTVYLDYNATAPIRPEALAAMTAALAEPGNASSVHGPGRRARRLIETARAQVAALADADPTWVIFTSGGTEANNLALAGLPAARLLSSAGEHHSPRPAAPPAQRLPLTPAGVLERDALAPLLAAAPAGDRVSER